MNRHPPEPLTQEERELAELVFRVGPHGEPATTLDAKILAAAHAAANRKPRRAQKPRWPVAMGLAASVVFAVGIAWQLRPMQQAPAMSSEGGPYEVAPSAGKSSEGKSSAMPAASTETATQTEPEPVTGSATPMHVDVGAGASTAAADVPMYAPPPPPVAKPLPPRAVSMPLPRREARIPPRQVAPVQHQAQDADRYQSLNALPPPAPPAPAMDVAAPAAEAPSAFAAEPREGAVVEHPPANEAAGASAARTAAAKQSAARAERKASPAIREQERGAMESNARDRTALDRVEVTGSRLQRTDLQVPISDDARLPVDEWLERVRTRYGLGDAEAARRSLLLFVREHPSEAVPGDLEPLLEK